MLEYLYRSSGMAASHIQHQLLQKQEWRQGSIAAAGVAAGIYSRSSGQEQGTVAAGNL
jgi:hypothetical protein